MSVDSADPLVSIIVITYNSSKYVLETLESAKAQTYQNIELIISDDGSTDKTIEICEKWLADNKERFVDSQIITVEKNTGIPANCNRGVKASKGEWIKLIAGDDVLTENCIEDNLSFIRQNPHAQIVQSLSNMYRGVFDEGNFIMQLPAQEKFNLFELSAEKQYKYLDEKDMFLCTPSIFLKKNAVEHVGLFDERFRYFEDYPMWLKLTKNNFQVQLLKKVTVKYRKHAASVILNNSPYMSSNFAKEYIFFLNEYLTRKRTKGIVKLKLIIFANQLGLNNRSLIGRAVFTVLLRF